MSSRIDGSTGPPVADKITSPTDQLKEGDSDGYINESDNED